MLPERGTSGEAKQRLRPLQRWLQHRHWRACWASRQAQGVQRLSLASLSHPSLRQMGCAAHLPAGATLSLHHAGPAGQPAKEKGNTDDRLKHSTREGTIAHGKP